MARLMIYGATGYSGRLCAREAARRGLDFAVAGRNNARVGALAKALGVEGLVVDVDDADGLNGAVRGADCVLNAAGPFAATASQVIDACIRQSASYIDITGEFSVFSLAQSRSARAQAAGVMLMPGVGWDVVPSDCVAAHAARRVAEPKTLRIGLAMPDSTPTRGTLRTVIEQGLATTFVVRRDGALVRLNDAPPARAMWFSFGERVCRPLTTGDLITGFEATHIPHIEIYLAADLGDAFVLPEGGIDAFPEGPTEAQLDTWRAFALAEVADADGRVVRSQIETKAGYAYTAEAAIEVAARILGGELRTGYQGPASVYGPSLATDIGAQITDLPDAG